MHELFRTETFTTLVLFDVPFWVFGVVFVSLLVFSLEFGYWAGRWQKTQGYIEESSGNVTLGALLGLLGLILAFTYAYSLDRLDNNRDAITNNANAIGTMFFRTDLMKEPDRTELRDLLFGYTQYRTIPWGADIDIEVAVTYTKKANEFEQLLWPTLVESTKRIKEVPLKIALISAMNDVYDTTAIARVSGRDQMPIMVLVMMVLVAGAAMFVTGNSAGTEGHMNRYRTGAFILVLTVVMLIIVDFDRPLSGLIKVNDYGMQALFKDLTLTMKH